MHPLVPPGGDWRLEIKLGERLDFGRVTSSRGRHLGQLEYLIELKQISDGVTVSDNGTFTVFAYGSTAAGFQAADRAIRKALVADGRTAAISAFRWDEASGSWREFDPPLAPGHEPVPTPPAAALRSITRTAECSAGRLVSKAYENDVRSYAEQLDIECRIVAKRGLFRTRLEITVTGPEDRVGQFLTYVRKLARSSSRVDPGLIPYGGF
jgi:hypothetical protein